MKRSRSSGRLKRCLVPDDRGDQRVHRVLGLVQVAAAHVDLQQMVLARGCGCAARAPPGHRPPPRTGSWAWGRGRATWRSGLPLSRSPCSSKLPFAQQHRVLRLVGAQQHGVDRHHVGPVEEVGDAAEALGLALREEAAARGVEARQRGVLLGRAGVADGQLEVAVGRVDDELVAVLAEATPARRRSSRAAGVSSSPSSTSGHEPGRCCA
jgi:hypothetical protein